MRYTANIRRAKDKDDIFPTPEWVTEALMSHVKFDGLVYEPACGYGHMAKVIEKWNKCCASDKNDLGYGQVRDFLENPPKMSNCITNPPYSHVKEFIDTALANTTGKVAMLCRIEFLSAQSRQEWFNKFPPAEILILGRRLKRWNKKTQDFSGETSAFSHIWIIWDCSRKVKQTIVRWI